MEVAQQAHWALVEGLALAAAGGRSWGGLACGEEEGEASRLASGEACGEGK